MYVHRQWSICTYVHTGVGGTFVHMGVSYHSLTQRGMGMASFESCEELN